MTDEDVDAGVDTARIRALIGEKLATRAIVLVPGRTGGEGTIGVNIGALRSSTGNNVTFFYFLDFRQQVKVERLPDPPFPPVPGVTWTSTVSFGTEPSDRIVAHLDSVTAEMIDAFLRDHRAAADRVRK